MTINAADPKQVEKARLKEVFGDRQLLGDFRSVLETYQGRRLMWWILEQAGIFKSSFTGNSTTFYNEGMRNIGLMVHAKIAEASPESILLMMQESKKREEGNDG